MEQLLARIRARLTEGAYPNEAAVSLSILLPLLRSLGWDDSDPLQVMPEYAQAGRRVDFALCAHPGRPSVFIEVKGVGRSLEGDRQLFEYAFHEGIPMCVLTDGREWSFYLPAGQGSYDERRVFRLQLTERSLGDSARAFERYLSRDRVRTGDALDDALRDYRDLAASRLASRALPKAWDRLVGGPEDLLVELVTEETEKVSGTRPTSEEVVRFLRSLSRNPARSPTEPRRQPQDPQEGGTVRPPRTTPAPPPSTMGVHYSVFGERRTAKTASSALVDILTELARRSPDKLEEAAEAVKGRSRNHIARSVEEIYPARPDLARAAEFAPGWLVGLNVANREKIRIIREVCRVMAVEFGRDVEIDLPNVDA